MIYNLFLAIHIIGFVCWFAGLFYLVRLFIYHRESFDKDKIEREVLTAQFILMENRLWRIIILPAFLTVLVTGSYLLYITKAWGLPWFHIKALLLIFLFIYNHLCRSLMKILKNGSQKWSSRQLRQFNEIATILLIAIVFSAKLKEPKSIGIALGISLALGLIIFTAIKCLKKR